MNIIYFFQKQTKNTGLGHVLLGSLIVLLLSHINLFSQKVGPAYMPAITKEAPEFYKIFHGKIMSRGKLNVKDLDKKFEKYEKETVSKNKAARIGTYTKNSEPNGEEDENAYILYYKRWKRFNEKNINTKGEYVWPNENNNLPAEGKMGQPKNESPFHEVSKNKNGREQAATSWSLLGPITTHEKITNVSLADQVNVYACAMAPSNHDILYAAPEPGGIFKTTDRGLNWNMVLDLPASGNGEGVSTNSGDAFLAIEIDPTNADIVYAGRRNLIKKTTDGGASWADATFSCGLVNTIIINPTNTNIVIAACDNGIYRSTDTGSSWALISSAIGRVTDISFKPDDPNMLYCIIKPTSATKSEMRKSIDGGLTFTTSSWPVSTLDDNGGRMTVSPANANAAYVLLTNSTPRVYKTTDAGVTWSLVYDNGINDLRDPVKIASGQGFYDWDIIANPLNAEEVIAGTTTAFKSTDGGFTFTALGGYYGPFSIHADIQSTISLLNETGGTDTWISTDGGMNYSTDFFSNLTNHTVRNKGIFGSDYWGFGQGWNEDFSGGGRYHNGNSVMYENWPTGQSLHQNGGESPTGYYMVGKLRTMVFSDQDGKAIQFPQNFNGANVESSTYNSYPNESDLGFFASELEFLPYCYNVIYRGGQKQGSASQLNTLFRSDNGGVIWTAVHEFNAEVKQFEISRSNPLVIYLATLSDLWKTTDGGTNWTKITVPTGVNFRRLQLALSFADENLLWITGENFSSGNRVFKSTNGGTSWVNLTTTTINSQSFKNLVHQQGTNGGVYLITHGGFVYYKNNTMADWELYNTGLPKGTYPLKTVPFYRDGKLRLAGNRSVWEVGFYEESAPVAQPMVDKLTSRCARDTFNFDDYSALNHAAATWLWSFSGTSTPTYISSTSVRNPKVIFGAVGIYDFTLTVSNGKGSSTKAIMGKITITEDLCKPDIVPGKLLSLNSPGDYAEQTTAPNINTNTLTLSAWIKPNGTQVSNAGLIVSKNSSGQACGFDFQTNNKLGYHWNGIVAVYNWTGGPTVPADEWSHVALVLTPNNATIYLNGVPYSRAGTYSHPAVNFVAPFQMGIERSNTARNYKGLMDEVAIYNRALSQKEIRELMHLTRNNPNASMMPAVDANLKAYYQFNEGVLPVYDKVGSNNLTLFGGASLSSTSTAPVGGGVSQTLPVTAAGMASFSVPGVDLDFASGTVPTGDVVVSRISVQPDQLPTTQTLPTPPAYYVIHNYGTNANFAGLNSMKFSAVQGTTAAMVSSPAQLQLFKRASNADGTTWGTPIDNADAVTNTAGVGTVLFSTGLVNTNFSQFSIGINPTTLPVKLISFTAILQPDSKVSLAWKVAEEVDFKAYEIEQSTDAVKFNKIGILFAKNQETYYYTDIANRNGLNYYRLKLVNNDGSFAYSQIRAVNIKQKMTLVINQNPVTNGWLSFTLKSEQAKSAGTFEIFNTKGQLIKSTYMTEIEANKHYFSGLSTKGIYIVRLTLTDGVVLNQKIVVE